MNLLWTQSIRDKKWLNKFLSLTGRLQLVQSILQSLSIYWLSALPFPIIVAKNIDIMLRNFLWTVEVTKWGLYWENACHPQEPRRYGHKIYWNHEQGLHVYVLKWIWQFFMGKDDPLVTWIKANNLNEEEYWSYKLKGNESYMWKVLFRLRWLQHLWSNIILATVTKPI